MSSNKGSYGDDDEHQGFERVGLLWYFKKKFIILEET